MGFVSYLSKEDLEKAKAELNENPETRDDQIKALLRRCKASPRIPAVCWPRLDPGFLLRYLRTSKFNEDKALERLENYFQLQKDWPELYGDFKFDTIKKLLDDGISELMPKKDANGVTTIVFRLEKWDTTTHNVHEVYRAAVFLWEYMLLDESVQVNGCRVVGDQGSLSWAHIRASPMRISKLWAKAVDNCYPIRNKKTAMIKFPGWFMTIYKIYQTFMSSKMQNRVMLVGRNDNLDKLYENFPKEYLPEDMGGMVSEKNQKEWTAKLAKKAKQIEKDFEYLKHLTSDVGTFTKLEDDMVVDMEKLKIEIEKETENGTLF